MGTLILDSTFFVDLDREQRRRKPASAHAFLRAHLSHELAMSIITRGELARGFGTREKWESFCNGFLVFGLDEEVLWTAAVIFRDLQVKGMPIADNDLWIAATALRTGLALVTENASHFRRIEGLKVLSHRDF
jgi:tRNA(fMet)-specific endonuclease VapC